MVVEHLTGGEAVVRSLLKHGVTDVFGVPGAQTYALYDALHDASSEIRTIGVRHEQAAAYMAFGYAQSSGRPGVYTVVPGPGVLNTAAGLATANAGNVPVFCVAGQVPSNAIGLGRGALHELPDQLALLRGLTRWAERVPHPSSASRLVAEAWTKMCGNSRGAVALEIPWDVMAARAPTRLESPLPLEPRPILSEESIERAAARIASAARPMIWVGSGALEAREEVLALAELLGAPVASFRGGRGIVGDDHPLALTLASAWHLWNQTDVLIAVGSRAEPPLMHWPERATPPDLVRIDINPVEMVRRRADFGVVGDAGEALREIVSLLRKKGVRRRTSPAEVKAARDEAERELADVQPQAGYLAAIRDVLPRDGFFVEDLCQVGY
ncbi:MAG TPA: thiamine pyrophosphate-binding protein, partial [Polyangiaceae bacterium]|nr:thiamine pyrophosphate-binding protein [Polyangiaceae bacterium]